MSTFKFGRRSVGVTANRKLATKAAQSWWLMRVLMHARGARPGSVPNGAVLLEAGNELEGLVRMSQTSGPRISVLGVQTCCDRWLRFAALTEDLLSLPKRHLTMHLLDRIPWFGNPALHANWEGDDLNRLLKACTGRVSQRAFEVVVMQQMRRLLAERGRTLT